MRFLRWFASLFSWEHVGEKGAWAYFQNTRTGERKAVKAHTGHSPKDETWLSGGPWIMGDFKNGR